MDNTSLPTDEATPAAQGADSVMKDSTEVVSTPVPSPCALEDSLQEEEIEEELIIEDFTIDGICGVY